MLKNEIKKENHCEKTKIPLASNLFFFYFKGIFSFYILSNTKLSPNLNYNNKKSIIIIQKYSLMPGLVFLLSIGALVVLLCNQIMKTLFCPYYNW